LQLRKRLPAQRVHGPNPEGPNPPAGARDEGERGQEEGFRHAVDQSGLPDRAVQVLHREFLIITYRTDPQKLRELHRRLADAALRRDKKAGAELLCEHIQRTADQVAKFLN
jgi:hypothetical protein